MARRPAAAVALSTRLGTVHRRLFDFLEGTPVDSRDLLASSLLPAGLLAGPPAETCRNDFYWLLIPEWLGGGLDSDVVDDILWAQYCIYCLFRALDDVVDGDAPDPHLAVAATLLTGEAGRTLRRHFHHGSPLWPWFDQALTQTTAALTALDRRQARAQRQGEQDLELCALLSRCLTVASRAVIQMNGKDSEWDRWLGVLDHLAVAGQILDDLHDMKADLAAGQLNFAAWFLTWPVVGSSTEATEAIIATTLATSDRLQHLFERVDRELAAADGLLSPGDDPRIATYVARFRRTSSQLSEALGDRHRHMFGDHRGPAPGRPTSYTSSQF